MTFQSIILLALLASVFLSVFVLGLNATPHDATYMFRNPGKLVRAFLAMNVVMPLFAVLLVWFFNFHPAVEIALVALSVSPIPPVLPGKLMKVGGSESYAVGLLVGAALISIITVPLTMEILGRLGDLPLKMSAMSIVPSILTAILIPLILGMLVHHFGPSFAERNAGTVSKVAGVGLLVTMLVILISAAPAIWDLIGNGTGIAIAAFVLVGLGVGHLLGGPGSEDRTALAISTASRHPGIALAIAAANFPDQKLASAAVLLYLIVNGVVSIPYLSWIKGRSPKETLIDAVE